MKALVLLLSLGLAASILAQADSPAVTEFPIPGSGQVAFVVTVNARSTGAEDAAALRVLADLIPRGAEEFTAADILRFGAQSGHFPRVVVTGDLLRLEVVVPAADLDQGARLMAAMVTNPRLRSRDLVNMRRAWETTPSEPYRLAFRPYRLDYSRVSEDDVRRLHQRLMRPERLQVLVAGAVEPGQGRDAWQRWTRRWMVPRAPRPPNLPAPMVPRQGTLSPTQTFVMRGRPLDLRQFRGTARVLATVALAVGKDSSVWRVWREQNLWGYELGGHLWPSVEGLQPTFILVRRRQDDPTATLVGMRTSLVKDIETWDESTLKRAAAIVQTALRRPTNLTPFRLEAGRDLGRSLLDRAVWRSMLMQAGQGGVSESALIQFVDNVDVASLKSEAKAMLDESEAFWVAD